MNDLFTLSNKESYKISCESWWNVVTDFHSQQLVRGEKLDERYKYLHTLYYDLVAKYRTSISEKCQESMLCQIQSIEGEMAQILLEFDEPLEFYG